jgi:hypothetical protein
MIVGLLGLLFWLCIQCTVRNFRPGGSVGAAWWPKNGEERVVNSPYEQVGEDGTRNPLYSFSSAKKAKQAWVANKAGERPMRTGVPIVRG